MVPRGAPPYRYNNQNPCLRSLCFLSISLPGFYRYDKEMARRPPRPTPRPLPPPLLLPVMPAASLYVGDLDPDVTESDLGDKFAPIAPLHSVRVCRSIVTGESLCYGYVNFWSPSDASKAMACLNHTDLKGKSMRIMWSQKDPSLRKSGVANLFVKNLDPSISSAQLHSIFGKFGTVLSCKVAEENGKSKGFGFVQFDKEEAAMAAQTTLHDTMLEGKKLYVSNFVKKSERKAAAEVNFTNLYVNNLIDNMTEDILKDIFSNFGEVSSVQIMKDDEGNSRGFGFVCFHSPDDAKNALANMNGVKLGSKTLFVGRAQKKAERTKMLKHAHRDMFNSHMERLKASNLYVKNLSKSIDDQKLKELFSSYGTITSARVMCNDNGMSKGFGFVSFSTPEEAKAALDELNGAVYGEGRLYVAIAQCKEDRLKEAQNNNQKLQNASTLPLYPSSSGITYARFQPLCFSLPTCPPPYAPVCQSFVSHLVGSVGLQHPFARKNYQQNFSSSVKIPMMHLGNSGDTGGWKYRQHSLTYGKSGIHTQDLNCSKSESLKVDLTKERTKKSGGAEGSTQIPSSLTLPGNSKKNTGDLLGSQNSSA